jgi:hypothetical protein
MIRYTLRCSSDHEFESWFANGAAYDRMAATALLDCPVCGDTRVSKALMTPAVAKAPGVKGRPDAATATAPAPPQQATAGPMPAQLLAVLQRMRAEVEKTCDYVGPDFAEEARRMHRGEAAERAIYGEATDDEAADLRDDGIEVAHMPWVPRAD